MRRRIVVPMSSSRKVLMTKRIHCSTPKGNSIVGKRSCGLEERDYQRGNGADFDRFTGWSVGDNPAAISANIHSVLLQDKSLETIDGFKDKVESVFYDAVREAMNQLHVDRFKRVVVGTMGTTV